MLKRCCVDVKTTLFQFCVLTGKDGQRLSQYLHRLFLKNVWIIKYYLTLSSFFFHFTITFFSLTNYLPLFLMTCTHPAGKPREG